ncbi:phospho-sugar mutase, partial [Winkia sp. UMB10116]|nr:phospho-sugar mutase [Winkia sp. UMB10116]
VRDKDGIATAVAFARLAAKQKDAGKTLQDALAELARRFGLYQTAPLTFRVDSLPEIARAMERLRENPPAALAGAAVNKIE